MTGLTQRKIKIMSRKPEPKFVVKYVENDLTLEEQEERYKKFIKHLVAVFKEQEELDALQANSVT